MLNDTCSFSFLYYGLSNYSYHDGIGVLLLY